MSTIRRPARWARTERRESTAGIAAFSGQRESQGFDHGRHRGCRAHRHAVARRARHAGLGIHKLIQAHGPGFDLFAEAPQVRAGADITALVLAVEHRTAGKNQRGDVATGGAHHQRRRRLVAAAHEHDTVNRVGTDRFLHVHAGQVAEQHRGGTHNGLAERGHRELDGKAASLPDAALHVIRQLTKMRVAGGQFRPRVADADDRAPVEHVSREPLVAHPASVSETILVDLAKPRCRAISALGFPAHVCSLSVQV